MNLLAKMQRLCADRQLGLHVNTNISEMIAEDFISED